MIDVTKCIGCKKGVSLFSKHDGVYHHMDLFATREVGAEYPCRNSEDIQKYLVENEGHGTYLPNEELKLWFKEQEFWFEDIIDLSWKVFPEGNKDFFNRNVKEGTKVWNLSNEELEKELLREAETAGIEVTEEEYPNLEIFSKKS